MSKPTTDKLDLNTIMTRAQEMQKNLQDVQQQVSKMEIVGQAGGGVVKITMNGLHYAKIVTIDPSLLTEKHSVLEDLVAAAINDCSDKIERTLREKMGSLAGMNLPGDLGL